MRLIFLCLIIGNILNAKFIRDDANNIVLDTSTQLIWQDNGNVVEDYKTKTVDGKSNWSATFQFCNNLDLAGITNWRVPNINELRTIINYNTTRPAKYPTFQKWGSIKNGSELYYTSSTTRMDDSREFWRVNFYTGFIDTQKKNNDDNNAALYLRCVSSR